MSLLRLAIGTGPVNARSSKSGVGLRGLHAIGYQVDEAAADELRSQLEPIDRVIAVGDQLSYAVYPTFAELGGEVEAGCASTAVSVDLRFDDGGRLSELSVRDQHGVLVDPGSQYRSKTLVVDQWNLKTVDLASAAGRRVSAVEVVVEGLGRAATGWLDEVRIGPIAAVSADAKPTDWVRTTRGTHSSGQFSRGNNAPLAAVPHGFNFVTPVTDAGTRRWIYSWHQHNGADNRPALQALAFSHIPSPWMGDRAIFQVCPTSQPGVPTADREARALSFDHDHETDRAHYYGLHTDSGLQIELAPTDHAVIMRFTFPDDNAALIFDQVDGNGSLTVTGSTEDGRPVVTGYVGAGVARGSLLPPMYVYGVVDRPATESGLLAEPGRERVCGYLRLDAGADRRVELRLASSFIGVEQAARNLAQELASDVTFEAVVAAADAQWLERLSLVSVEGATQDQLVTLYSNLYRLFLYPNSMSENIGTPESPRLAYASPFQPPAGPHTAESTGCVVVDGACSVNNGFWDTYRTCWPALTLLDPERAGGLLDGFVQHFRDGGWTARWSSPGYADCMVGTSSDIVLADAFVKNLPGVDYVAGYDSAIRNATVPATDRAVGRNGLETAIFRGYVDTDTTEGMSWTLESAINDYGLAVWSERLLAEAGPEHPRRREFEANAVYFGSRALAYAHMFDDRVGFFQGRTAGGDFRLGPEDFDPALWGYDFTETNGWGMAFTVPHDPAGLAALYGGDDRLAAKLDEFFATPETAAEELAGSYGTPIHEMTEARTVRMGMLALSNQPAHHIPYLYLQTGAAHKTQAITRECLSRLFLGSEIGQGYPGDEDNGEMSAWWLFNALGFYPLSLGSGEYVITTPLFERAEVRLPNGRAVEVVAHRQAADHVYIQSLTIDGNAWPDPVVPHDLLAAGARLEFELGPEPSSWGSGGRRPAALTPAGQRPTPLVDLTRSRSGAAAGGPGDPSLVFDDSSADALTLAPGGWVSCAFDSPVRPVLYTLTGSPDDGPRSWLLEGSDDQQSWQTLDERSGESYRWQRQTRPFLVDGLRPFRHFRLRLTGAPDAERAVRLYQWELLA
ncbi:hypothetical protein GCM10009841_31880 [Microlunatus panaciterrae]|uniref:Alpha-1,2-mannosidase n=1 Tax=Microlunatus panaciterrae TaxID=400768 RepID=A0ABS2RFS7_9ACTN|nr:GH92 family glycosyl hydrolase [Microlunatus panaciterrae]MBM7797846.1 putative alpha-1,2-mannosidase [Microlunatus panaciterrae]